jgi:energy-coupling factor transporter ATP-binding protein EcfA2
VTSRSKFKRPPTLNHLLSGFLLNSAKPVAFVLTGHNGSGKSTLWYLRMADQLEMPLINADRLTLSILPPSPLPDWAVRLRDKDDRWQKVSQGGVNVFRQLVMDQGMSFAYETRFKRLVVNLAKPSHRPLPSLNSLKSSATPSMKRKGCGG